MITVDAPTEIERRTLPPWAAGCLFTILFGGFVVALISASPACTPSASAPVSDEPRPYREHILNLRCNRANAAYRDADGDETSTLICVCGIGGWLDKNRTQIWAPSFICGMNPQ